MFTGVRVGQPVTHDITHHIKSKPHILIQLIPDEESQVPIS